MPAPDATACSRFRGRNAWCGSCALLLLASATQADVIYDGKISHGSPVSSPFTYNILESHGSRPGGPNGPNLFHGFKEFSVPAGMAAVFSGSPGVKNILARVSNGPPSQIDGSIRSTIPNANLFLMNSAGIVFGEGASVSVSGAFTATTADYIELADEVRFHANENPSDALLTSAPPTAFGFLTQSPKGVSVSSFGLLNPPGKAFAVVAGDIDLQAQAQIVVPNGLISLISVGSAGRVALSLDGLASLPQLTGFGRGGVIRLQPGSTVSTRLSPGPTSGGGRIVIRAGKLMMDGATVASDLAGAAQTGGIDIAITGSLEMKNESQISSAVFADETGKGGDLTIAADTLLIASGSFIQSNTTGAGAGGRIAVQASGDVTIDREGVQNFTGIVAATGGPGPSGGLSLEVARTLTMRGDSEISATTRGAGLAGSVLVTAGAVLLDGQGATRGPQISANSEDAGDAGLVRLDISGRLTLLEGAALSATSFAAGTGGRVAVRAGDILADQGSGSKFTGLAAQTLAPHGGGAGGSVQVETPGTLTLRRGAVVTTDTKGNGTGGAIDVRAGTLLIDGTGTDLFTGITAQSLAETGGGRAGPVRVDVAGRLTIQGTGAIASDTFGTGAGNDVTIHAGEMTIDRLGATRDYLGVTALSRLGPENGRGGSAGNLDVRVDRQLTIRNGGLIDSSTFGTGAAGDVRVRAGRLLIDRAGSPFFTGIGSDTDGIGGGPGGDLFVEASTISLEGGGLISTGTFGSGPAGNVRVVADQLHIRGKGEPNRGVVTEFSGIVASTAHGSTGAGGSVTVEADRIGLSDGGLIGAATRGSGPGGDVSIRAGSVEISRGGQIAASTVAAGRGGSVLLRAERLSLSDGAAITASATGLGAAGSIGLTIDGPVLLTGESSVAVSSLRSDAGKLTFRASGRVSLRDSALTAEAQRNGGDIELAAPSLDLSSSRITANAVTGEGGLITLRIPAIGVLGDPRDYVIVSDFVRQSGDSRISASSQLGVQGALLIDAPQIDLSNALEGLTAAMPDASRQLREACVIRFGGVFSSFLVIGRGGVEDSPDQQEVEIAARVRQKGKVTVRP